jgi:nitric oxide reductase activation protein
MSILRANNTTPEGLCFEAIQKQLIPSNNDTDSFFLNFSDGQPCYSIGTNDDSINYQGEAAAEHTRKQVNKMRNAGINTLSYFISDYSEDRIQSTSDWRIFQKCYGKDAKAVNVENMMQVAKTMNELFLQK